jgi:hypothetical protein
VKIAIRKLRGLICGAVAGICLTFTSYASATAFQVNFDPPDLVGTAIFELTAPCLATDNNYNTIPELLGLVHDGCVVSLERASISTLGGPDMEYVAELPFVFYSSLLISNHQLAGLTTGVLLPFVGQIPAPIRLEPAGGEFIASSLLTSFSHDDCDPTLSFTVTGAVTFVGCGTNGRPLPALFATVDSITQVPEPGTLGLLIGAGVAGWWTRRRRQFAR